MPPTHDLALTLLAATVLACGLAGLALARWPRWQRWEKRWGSAWLEGAMVLLVLGCSVWLTASTLAARNPQMLPACGDLGEYLAYTARFVDPAWGALSAYRYPLQPALAATLCDLLGLTPAAGTMAVAIAAAASVPLALYLLGRLLAPGPVAAAGALLVLATPAWIGMLSRPSDYMLSGLLQILALAAVVAALQRAGPWRLAGAGLTLAALMASTPKALGLLLLALPLLLLVALLRHARQPARLALGLLGLAAPLVLCWWLFSTVDWELRSLEHATIRVVEYAWHEVGFPVSKLQFPEVVRSSGVDGYWVVGQADALTNLPRTIAFLRHVPQLVPPEFHGRALLEQALRSGLGLAALGWLLLLVPGATAIGRLGGRSWRDLSGWALSAAFLGAFLVMQAQALTLIVPHERYLLALALPLPLVVVVGMAALPRLAIAPCRRLRLAWLPVLALVLLLLARHGGALGVDARTTTARQALHHDEASGRPLAELAALRPTLTPQDQVVDLTPEGLAIASLLQAHPTLAWRPWEHAVGTVDPQPPVAPHLGGRRFLVDPCRGAGPPSPDIGLLQLDTRYRRVSPCIYEDVQPELALRL
jgi:hypothetical protein